jgi:hypothetical protein
MGVLDMIRKLGENKKELKQKMTEAQQDRRIQKVLNEREKSSNERELERHIHDAREANIKTQLDEIRNRKNHENWKGNNFQGKATMLKDDRPMLKEKNIFLNEKSMFLDNKSNNPITQRGMFFK